MQVKRKEIVKMQEYKNMWLNYVNFSDRTNRRGCWMAVLCNFIVAVIIGIITAILPFLIFITWLYSLAVLVPGISLGIRRLRDAGKEWYNIFWSLLPVVGTIIFIIMLCKPSIGYDGTPVV